MALDLSIVISLYFYLRTSLSIPSMLMLVCYFFVLIRAVLSEEESLCLVVNKFINSMGKKRGNIPLDLFMEHLHLLF